jgi:flagellin-like hook-associated protein FlgL
VFKSLCSEFKLVGRNLFKIIKPQAGSREERTFDRDTAELALSLPTLFIARNTITPLLNRVTGNIIAGSVGSAIGPDGIDGSAIVIPATGLNLANSAIAGLDLAIAAVNTGRSEMGATMNRLEYAADNLANISANATESRGRILDADYAKETTELARTQIIAQAGTAMLAQANQVKQTVLSLLK